MQNNKKISLLDKLYNTTYEFLYGITYKLMKVAQNNPKVSSEQFETFKKRYKGLRGEDFK